MDKKPAIKNSMMRKVHAEETEKEKEDRESVIRKSHQIEPDSTKVLILNQVLFDFLKQ